MLRQTSLSYSDVGGSNFLRNVGIRLPHYMPLHAKNQQLLCDVKFSLVPGTGIKKPARKATQFTSVLWSASQDNSIFFALGEGIPESAASRNEDEGRLFSYLCDVVCEKGQPGRDFFLLQRERSKNFYTVVWVEMMFRGKKCRNLSF